MGKSRNLKHNASNPPCKNHDNILPIFVCLILNSASHSLFLPLSPFLIQWFYPTLPISQLGYYSGFLSGLHYIGHAFSYSLWEILLFKQILTAKSVLSFSLIATGSGLVLLGLVHDILPALGITFAIGLFNGILPAVRSSLPEESHIQQHWILSTTSRIGFLFGPTMIVIVHLCMSELNLKSILSNYPLHFFVFVCCALFSLVAFFIVLCKFKEVKLANRGRNSKNKSYSKLGMDDTSSPLTYVSTKLSTTPSDIKNQCSLEETMPFWFVDACNGDKVEGMRRWKSTLKWRCDRRIDDILNVPNPYFDLIRRIIPHFFHGYSKSGHLIMYDFLGKIDVERFNKAGITEYDLIDHYAFLAEFALNQIDDGRGEVIYVVDLAGLSTAHTKGRIYRLFKSVVKVFQEHYPERLNKLVILNPPVWFKSGNILSSFSAKTVSKVIVQKSNSQLDVLLKLFEDISIVPEIYNGENYTEFGESAEEILLQKLVEGTTSYIGNSRVSVSDKRLKSQDIATDGGNRDSDSDEESFFDCSEYGLDALEEEERGLIINNSVNADSTSAELFSQRRKDQVGVHFDRNTPVLGVGEFNDLDCTQPYSIDMRCFFYDAKLFKVLCVFSLWLIVQTGFDELFSIWYINRRSQNQKESHVSSAFISSILSSSAVLVLLVYHCLCANVSNNLTPLASFRAAVILQIPLLAFFPVIEAFWFPQQIFSVGAVIFTLLCQQLSRSIAYYSILLLLNNSVCEKRRVFLSSVITFIEFSFRGIASSIAPSLFSFAIENTLPYPFGQMLMYGGFCIMLLIVLLLTAFFPIAVNSPRLFFL